MKIGGEFGDRRRLADSGGTDQSDQSPLIGTDANRSGDRDLVFDHPRQSSLQEDRIVKIMGTGSRSDPLEKLPCQFLGHFRIDQIGKERKERTGEVAHDARLFALIQRIDEGLEARRLIARVIGTARGRRIGEPTGDLDAGRCLDFDPTPSGQPTEQVFRNLASLQYGGSRPQLLADHAQGLWKRASSKRPDIHVHVSILPNLGNRSHVPAGVPVINETIPTDSIFVSRVTSL